MNYHQIDLYGSMPYFNETLDIEYKKTHEEEKETNRKKELPKDDRAMFPEGTIDLIQEIEKERE